MAKTVIALFDNLGQAEDAADALRAAGYARDRIAVEVGEDLLRRGELPPPAHEQNLWAGIRRFFDELGLTQPGAALDDDHRSIEPDDGIVMLETSDERAEDAAELLDRAGALSIEERKRWREDGVPRHRAMGLEPETAGRTPPELEDVNSEPGDIDERSLAGTPRPHRARIYSAPDADELTRH
jgi:hypothetical protein